MQYRVNCFKKVINLLYVNDITQIKLFRFISKVIFRIDLTWILIGKNFDITS